MLRFSLRTEYAIRALMELAARRDEGPVPARVIARAQNVPLRVLEHQLSALSKAGLVVSQRGASGGCALARDPADVRIADVVDVIEGPLAPMFCLEPHNEDCERSHRCGLQDLWMRIETAVRDVFERTTLADLVSRQRELSPLLWPTRATSES